MTGHERRARSGPEDFWGPSPGCLSRSSGPGTRDARSEFAVCAELARAAEPLPDPVLAEGEDGGREEQLNDERLEKDGESDAQPDR